MVFWSAYVIRSWWSQDRFRSELINKPPIPSPTGREAERLIDHATEIRTFLQTHFGNPPHSPILDLTETELLESTDHFFLVRDRSDQIAGTIRYHFIGNLITSNSEPIYVVDAFCIHPRWRKKGVGDYLLTHLHRYANERGIPYAMFLKEGIPLSIQPHYTGWYRYRRITKHIHHPCITTLTISQAYQIMDIFRSIRPNLFLIRNPNTSNQIWKWFRKGRDQILIGIQDAHQRIDHKKIGWITTWIESPLVTEEARGEAADAVADQIFPVFDYLWINEKWIGSSNMWKCDGAFHWYMYQWLSSLEMDQSYGLMM
jgi:GNAT superfamily N-acetyltransferase